MRALTPRAAHAVLAGGFGRTRIFSSPERQTSMSLKKMTVQQRKEAASLLAPEAAAVAAARCGALCAGVRCRARGLSPCISRHARGSLPPQRPPAPTAPTRFVSTPLPSCGRPQRSKPRPSELCSCAPLTLCTAVIFSKSTRITFLCPRFSALFKPQPPRLIFLASTLQVPALELPWHVAHACTGPPDAADEGAAPHAVAFPGPWPHCAPPPAFLAALRRYGPGRGRILPLPAAAAAPHQPLRGVDVGADVGHAPWSEVAGDAWGEDCDATSAGGGGGAAAAAAAAAPPLAPADARAPSTGRVPCGVCGRRFDPFRALAHQVRKLV